LKVTAMEIVRSRSWVVNHSAWGAEDEELATELEVAATAWASWSRSCLLLCKILAYRSGTPLGKRPTMVRSFHIIVPVPGSLVAGMAVLGSWSCGRTIEEEAPRGGRGSDRAVPAAAATSKQLYAWAKHGRLRPARGDHDDPRHDGPVLARLLDRVRVPARDAARARTRVQSRWSPDQRVRARPVGLAHVAGVLLPRRRVPAPFARRARRRARAGRHGRPLVAAKHRRGLP